MALIDEIMTGPLAAEVAPYVATRHDAMVAKILNDPRYPIAGNVGRAEFVIWAASGPRATIEDVATNQGHPLRASALTLLDFMRGAAESIDLGNPAVSALFDAWVSAGAITAEQQAALQAHGTRVVGRAESVGLGVVHHSQVSAALNGG